MELPIVHHLLVSLGASYDINDPINPYSLDHLAFSLKPPGGIGYPFTMSQMWLFARIEGNGNHELWAEVYRLGEPADELLAAYGPFIVPFGADRRSISRGWCLHGVPFFSPGWYEFRLTCGGEVVAAEPVFLED